METGNERSFPAVVVGIFDLVGLAAIAGLWWWPGRASTIAALVLMALAFALLVLQRWEAMRPRDPRRGLARALLGAVIGVVLVASGGAMARLLPGAGVLAPALRIAGVAALGYLHVEILIRVLLRRLLPAPVAGPPLERIDCTPLRWLCPSQNAGHSRPGHGLDLRDSWAFRFVRRALPYYLAGLAVLAWLCTGLTSLALDERGIYEWLGRPQAVWGPGLHWHGPWPFGRVRRFRYGAVHRLLLVDNDSGTLSSEAEALRREPPPVEAVSDRWQDRLWERSHGRELYFLTAGPDDAGDEARARRPFEIINADVVVLWRIGEGARDLRAFAYGSAAPGDLLRRLARRWVQSVFTGATPERLIGLDREDLSRRMTAALRARCRELDLGIDIVGINFEAIHPPLDAALSYYEVQAAERDAASQIASARARAAQNVAAARVQAGVAADEAGATRVELISDARARSAAAGAQAVVARDHPSVFRLERFLEAFAAMTRTTPLTVIDRRLDAGGATIDLRPVAQDLPPMEDND